MAHGRASGRARSDDGALDLDLRMPAELGGDGRGTNPEQLFAAGFAACFHGAIGLVARQAALDPTPISVKAAVAFGRDPEDGSYVLHVDLVVTWPDVDPEVAAPVLEKADALCPYAVIALDDQGFALSRGGRLEVLGADGCVPRPVFRQEI
ncbi:Ohr family peroxiredoxin [Streptomyces sp. NPDC059340]|uniref:Ohr family peroxiredoxin n=1 Tax=Streptomyces sp. NPDC059340 TaxID=3346806 RepID=UPI0036B633CD